MRILKFQIENYKSIYASDEIQLTPGFNVIVGQNNVGKTAILETLSLDFSSHPHRSPKTSPSPSTSLSSTSLIRMTFDITRAEMVEAVEKMKTDYFHIATSSLASPPVNTRRFLEALDKNELRVSVLVSGGSLLSGGFDCFDDSGTEQKQYVHLKFDLGAKRILRDAQARSISSNDPKIFNLESLLGMLKARMFRFNAERLYLSEAEIKPKTSLSSDASNLAQVLNFLQSDNVSRFSRYNRLVSRVFPEIRQITTPPRASNRANIVIWSIDPETERRDLAISLSESGTGIGQVLAILYVIVTAELPRIIIIDEPQSFLHPGAIRKLFEILHEYPQHQYIIATHSPTVITAANPSTILLARKQGAETSIEPIDVTKTNSQARYLSEIGASLADVFGADNRVYRN